MNAVQKPNILLFIMDDQTPLTIRALGNPHISTPNLDKLIESGCFFRPYTTVPVCTPGRAELLTGRTALRNGCDWFNKAINPDITLLPHALSGAGYHCCHIGKWHNDGHPRDRGYHETHFVFPSDLEDPYNGHQFTYFDGDEKITGHSTELLCGSAEEFLKRAPEEKPWFCYVALHSPHDPREAPEPWAGMYKDNLPPLPPNFMPEHPFDNGDMMIRDERLAGFPRQQDEIRSHLADYYAMISHHDHYIGQVIRQLEESGQKENTIIVFTSDHGLACGCHGLMGKENLYEHSARVPLIISGPSIPESKRFDEDCLCGHYDFIPTLMDLLGLAIPESTEGISYADVINGNKTTIRKTIAAAYRNCMRMARNDRFKMIYYPHCDRYQLFDIKNDPDETNDLMLPWRREAEARCCPPPLSPTQKSYTKDPDLSQEHAYNPLYKPKVSSEVADQQIDELKTVLNQWQIENDDPVL